MIATWVAGLAGYVIASGIPATYEGHARLLVGPRVGNVDVMRAAASISNTYGELSTNTAALEQARATLGLPADESIDARATSNETTRILDIRAEHGDPATAAAIANALADNLMAQGSEGVTLPEGQLEIVEPAVVNPDPIAPQVTLIAIIAATVGLLASAVLVLLVEYFGNTINSSRELIELSRVPFQGFASLGQRFRPNPDVPTIVQGKPDSRAAGAIRMIATKLAYTETGAARSSALIVGTAAHDGAADLAVGVATALARSGRRVLLMDANDEQAELTALLGMSGRPGLTDLLDNPRLDVAELAVARPQGPWVVGCGRSTRVELVTLETAQKLMARLTSSFEVVILTAGPIHLSGSALVWARSVESVLVGVQRDRGKRDDLVYALDNLAAVRASVYGTVLLDHPPRARRSSSRRQPSGSAAARSSSSERGSRPGALASTVPEASHGVRRPDEVGR